jgi:HEPN domain-containing protein
LRTTPLSKDDSHPMSAEGFIQRAWADHAEAPQRVADEIAQSVSLIASPTELVAFAQLLTHVYGEHLGRWHDGVTLLESLRARNVAGDADAERALARNIATLRHAAGDRDGMTALPVEDRIASLATVASAMAARHEFKRAIAAYGEASSLAEDGILSSSPAIRALAVGGNNLAAALEDKTDRDSAETRSMVDAAEAGLKFWRLAGTWLEEERAEYRLAKSLLEAGDTAASAIHAQACVAVCEANGAPPFERFFGYVALALAQRRAGESDRYEASRGEALRLHALLSADERQACESDRAALFSDVRSPAG